MKFELREIASKSAGTYFIVTDKSAVQEIESTSNLRLFFINVEQGVTNTAVYFKQGAFSTFESIFGKRNRKQEKQGNYSIKACLDALKTAPIVVINLRRFDNSKDKTHVFGLSPSNSEQEKVKTAYTNLFNRDSLWKNEPENIQDILTKQHLLNLGNVGNNNISVFVTAAKKSEYEALTSQGDMTLSKTKLNVDNYPALEADESLKIKDTFVTVWVFDNVFADNTTNRYYGHLFSPNNLISTDNLEKLSKIPESGFNAKITGSLIPNLKSEFDENISIDTLVNNKYGATGVIAHINTDLLEKESLNGRPVINHNLDKVYKASSEDYAFETTGLYLSHRLQPLTKATWDNTTHKSKEELISDKSVSDVSKLGVEMDLTFLKDQTTITADSKLLSKITDFGLVELKLTNTAPLYVDAENKNKIKLPTQLGFNIGTTFKIGEQYVSVTRISGHHEVTLTNNSDTLKYEEAIYELDGIVSETATTIQYIKGVKNTNSLVTFDVLESYKKREEQFTDGTSERQNEILDVMLSKSIINGIKKLAGIRYIVDAFKSFVESNYKYQYGVLAKELDKKNKFVRCILNEPFIKSLSTSTNPLFKDALDGVFDIEYLRTGGNEALSTKFLNKFEIGGEMCYFFGGKLDDDNRTETIASVDVSNKFITKKYPWDVVANASGYIGIDGVVLDPDENQRLALEKFKWNPITKKSRGFAVYGNFTAQKELTSLSQIHNSELLAYIKESLYNMVEDEHFKKGNYDEYLQVETRVKAFMDSLALQNAIEPNPIVICSAENNTPEISKQRIKLISVSYTNLNALDKIVFDLTIN